MNEFNSFILPLALAWLGLAAFIWFYGPIRERKQARIMGRAIAYQVLTYKPTSNHIRLFTIMGIFYLLIMGFICYSGLIMFTSGLANYYSSHPLPGST